MSANPLPDIPDEPTSFWADLVGRFKQKTSRFVTVLSTIFNPFYTKGANFRDWTTQLSVEEGMKIHHLVNACVNFRANEIAQVPWTVEKRGKGGKWERVKRVHPAEDLLETPNDFQTRFFMFQQLSMFLDLTGNAFLHKVRDRSNGVPVEVWALNPDLIFPVPNPRKFLDPYRFVYPASMKLPEGVERETKIPVRDLIHLMYPNPANPYWGLSLLQAIGKIVDTDVEMIRWQNTSLMNRCVKDGILSVKRHLTSKQYREIREQFKEQNLGADAARGPVVLGEDVNYLPMSMTPAEFDFGGSRKFNKVDIMSSFFVPPPLLGYLENATYANIGEARTIFWLDVVLPWLEMVRQVLQLHVMTEFDDPSRYRIMYDLTQVWSLRGVLDKLATTAQKFFQMGFPANEINERMGLGFRPFPVGELSFVQSSMIQVAESDTILVDQDPNQPATADEQQKPVNSSNLGKKPVNEKPEKPPKEEQTNVPRKSGLHPNRSRLTKSVGEGRGSILVPLGRERT